MGRVRNGVHPHLEAAADALLYESIKDVTSREEKADIMTPWKEKNRRMREVHVAAGAPDSSIRQGLFNRAYNSRQPHLNSYLGPTRPIKMDTSWDPYEGDSGASGFLSPQMATAVGLERVDS